MATCDILPGAVHVLKLGFLHFYVNTFNANINLQQSGDTSKSSVCVLRHKVI